jgi:hypothetical protein
MSVIGSIIKKSKGDKYITPKYAWEWIQDFIPKDKIIWEPFNDGSEKSLLSSKYLQELGFKVISPSYNEETKENDFFTSNEGDIIVSNPPFSIRKLILKRLMELDKPFILILPTSTINNQYFKPLKKHIQIIIPKRRINFTNFNENKSGKKKSNCCFDCLYICYKMNLPKDLIWC